MKKRRFWIPLLIVALLTGLYLARAAILPAVASWLDVGEPPQRADAIMLLTGDAEKRGLSPRRRCGRPAGRSACW